MNSTLGKISSFAAVSLLMGAQIAHAERDKDRGVGAGIAYAAPNQALIMNPAVIGEAGNVSLEGLWRTPINEPWVSVEGAYKGVGLAADYRQDPGYYFGKTSTERVYQAGVGVKINDIVGMGATVRSQTSRHFDLDVGANIDFKIGRVGVVARSLAGGSHTLVAGLGIKIGPNIIVEGDILKTIPFNRDDKYFTTDITAVASVHQISLGIGYTFDHNETRKFYNGKVHASASVEIVSNFFGEVYYRPLPNAWYSSDWAFGARYTF